MNAAPAESRVGSAPSGRPLLLSLALALAAQWPGLTNPFVVNDDVRQQLFWMRRWLDPALYPPDLLNGYAQHYVTWGVQALYRAAAFLGIGPLFCSKLVAVGLLAWLGTLLFAMARRLGGAWAAWTTLAVYGLMPGFAANISGGLNRAFAAPLLALFLLALLRGSQNLARAALLAQALFIPYILLPSLGLCGLWWTAWKVRLVRTPPVLGTGKAAWLDLACAALALGLAVAWQSGLTAYGPLPWAADMAGRPEFGPDGRFAILPVPPLWWELFARPWELIAPFRDGSPWLGITVTALLLPLLFLGLRDLDRDRLKPALPALGCLLLASVLLYFAARILLFKLFVPSRYLEYTTNILYCLGLGLSLAPLTRSLARGSAKAGLVLLLAAALLGAWRLSGTALYDYSGDAALYAAVQKSPKNAMFAGHPTLMDNVLTFGERNVYASFELAHPWNAAYWSQVAPRLERLFRAYYAEDKAELVRFCAEEGVDFLVADRRHFSRTFLDHAPFFAPFDRFIQEAAAHGNFAVLGQDLPRIPIDANIFMLDMRDGSSGENRAPGS